MSDLGSLQFTHVEEDGVLKEKPWFTRLAEWSAEAPAPRAYAKAYRSDDVELWLREVWHVVSQMGARIDALEAEVNRLRKDAQP